MIKKEKLIKEVVINHRICDDCGLELAFYELSTCCKCGKDLCTQCVEHIEDGDDDDNDNEYAYCKSCWNIGEEYRKEIEKHQEAIDKLQEAWDNECKQNSSNQNEKSN